MKRQEAQEGIIAAFYTLNGWFVKVKQAFSIEKVCFSFVKKGEHGKGFNIYVSIDVFDNLCDEILSGSFEQKLLNDNGPFPGAFKYVCGKNGINELAIGKGTSQPIVIQGRNKQNKEYNAFVGVLNYGELRTMAKWFRRTAKKYFEDMSELVVNAAVYKPKESEDPQEQYIPEMMSEQSQYMQPFQQYTQNQQYGQAVQYSPNVYQNLQNTYQYPQNAYQNL